MASPRFEENYYKGLKYSDVYKTLTGTITGTGTGTVWTPAAGKRILLKGLAINGVISITLAAASPVELQVRFTDSSPKNIPLGVGFYGTQAAGGTFEASWDFAEGIKAVDAGSVLKIGPHITTGAGVISYNVVAWGEEV